MQNGEIQTEPTESKAVQEIFKAYLNGSSLLAIANLMSSQGVSYNGVSSAWNKNMVKRILENEKYLGRNGYPAIVDEDTFRRANMRKKIKSTTVAEISEELKVIRSLTYCTECGHRISRIGGNTRSEKWDCRNPECSRFSHRITDQMLIGAILNTLNTVIANHDLIDINSEISGYTPSVEPDDLDWWKILLAVLALIVLLIIFMPILPYVIKAIVWVILLPFKLIGWIFKSISDAVKKRKQ